MKTILKVILFCLPFTATSQNYGIIDFDTSGAGVFIDTNLISNVWQIGVPQKTCFTSALTLPNAIMTDTINPYPTNNYSVFYITIPNVYWSGVNLEFKHKFDSDTLIDGGKIEVSSDKIIWTNLINSNALYYSYGFYSNLNNVSSMIDFGFSGRSNNWQLSGCYWNYPQVDTMYLRFVFTSDNIQTNRDGWMIDSVRIWTNLGIGINEIGKENLFSVFPNPATGKFFIKCSKQFGKVKSVDLFSPIGQLITTSNQSEIDLSFLENGLYFIVGTNDKGEKFTSRIIKE
ncbi:MAG TPA: T9SS type A sorting domain-containing protein [Chitinophagales bacterium]|nr:T9SS type A sorting domain-containing protein [Chitinophagales bacterium]